jgi:hypothetical protein
MIRSGSHDPQRIVSGPRATTATGDDDRHAISTDPADCVLVLARVGLELTAASGYHKPPAKVTPPPEVSEKKRKGAP